MYVHYHRRDSLTDKQTTSQTIGQNDRRISSPRTLDRAQHLMNIFVFCFFGVLLFVFVYFCFTFCLLLFDCCWFLKLRPWRSSSSFASSSLEFTEEFRALSYDNILQRQRLQRSYCLRVAHMMMMVMVMMTYQQYFCCYCQYCIFIFCFCCCGECMCVCVKI